jgi:hypothetical protein
MPAPGRETIGATSAVAVPAAGVAAAVVAASLTATSSLTSRSRSRKLAVVVFGADGVPPTATVVS